MKSGKLRKRKYRKWILLAVGASLLIWSSVWKTQHDHTVMVDHSDKNVSATLHASSQWKRSLQPFPEIRMAESPQVKPGSEEREHVHKERVVPQTAIVRYHPVVQEPTNHPPLISRITVASQSPAGEERRLVWNGPVAPTGRILQVELVNTIDSSLSHNPIIGLITHDFYWEGHLLIPAGTEVHGMATVETSRQNLLTGMSWNLVFIGRHDTLPNGWVLPLQAVALERQDATGEGKTFGWSDMRMGLPGMRMRAEDELDIKLFLSGFLSAAVSSLQTRQVNNMTGVSMLEETAENAALSGVVQVLQQYGERILQEIERVGFYLRVRAGTQFYLLVQEPLDLNRGMEGGRAGGLSYPHAGSENRKADTPVLDLKSLQRVESQIGEQWEELWNQYMRTVGK